MAEGRREEIIRAAVKRFGRHGLGKTTLDEIARDVRIGKPTIYHYFKSKDDLFYISISWETEQYIEDVKAIFNNQDMPIGARLLEYFILKEKVYQKYKLLYDLMLSLFKNDSLEKEKLILHKLIKDEEEVVGLILSSIYTSRIESMEPNLPSFIVHQSWGLMFSTILKDLAADGKQVNIKDLLFKSLERLLS